MPKKKLKPVYFNTTLEADLLKWVKHDRINNFSEYVKGLIRKDMQFRETGVSPQLMEHIENILDTKLAECIITKKREVNNDGMNELIEDFF